MVPQKNGTEPPGKAKPFAVSFSAVPKKTFNIPQNPRPQTGLPARQKHRHLAHDDSDEEEDTPPVHEEVTGFDTSTGGAISKNAAKAKEPLVIKMESTNNWRDRPGVNRRGKKNLLPQEVQAAGREGAAGGVVETDAPSMAYGLSLGQSKKDDITDDTSPVKDADVAMADIAATDAATAPEPKPREPLSQDELALQALIRESEGGEEKTRRSDLVIESVNQQRYDETTSYRADVATRPDQASLEAYDAVPVEEFGAALLRGMGWKEGQAIGRRNYGGGTTNAAVQVRIPERRPGFLGIGAKDVSGGKGAEIELGAWGKAAMRKGSKRSGDGSGSTEGVYMPVVMKSKTTGEYLTEEEFKLRQKEAATSQGRKTEKRDDDRYHSSGNGRDRDRSRRYDDYDDGDDNDRSRRYGKSSSRRDRSRSSGAYDSRSRRNDDDGTRSSRDSRRYRDRDDSDYKSRPRSRDRSHAHSRRDKDYHRTRDRDRDSERARSDRNRYKDSHK